MFISFILFCFLFAASRSDVKLKLEVNGINLDRCDDIYQRYLGVKLTSKQLCAGGEEGRDSCSGDSGK